MANDGLVLWHFKLAASIGYSAALIFGLPIYVFVLEKNKWRGLSEYAVAGAAIGIGAFFIPFIAPIVLERSFEGLAYVFGATLPFAFVSMILGVLSASGFWLIAVCNVTK